MSMDDLTPSKRIKGYVIFFQYADTIDSRDHLAKGLVIAGVVRHLSSDVKVLPVRPYVFESKRDAFRWWQNVGKTDRIKLHSIVWMDLNDVVDEEHHMVRARKYLRTYVELHRKDAYVPTIEVTEEEARTLTMEFPLTYAQVCELLMVD